MRTELVTDTLDKAVAARGGRGRGIVPHADRGSQYTASAMAAACRCRLRVLARDPYNR